jgi:death-on-curing family protein
LELFSVADIRRIQYEIILRSEDALDHGFEGKVRDEGALALIVSRAENLSDPYQKSAYFLLNLTTYHPFFQGNKRTGLAVAGMVLMLSSDHRCLTAGPEEINRFVREIAQYRHTLDEVERWLRENSG